MRTLVRISLLFLAVGVSPGYSAEFNRPCEPEGTDNDCANACCDKCKTRCTNAKPASGNAYTFCTCEQGDKTYLPLRTDVPHGCESETDANTKCGQMCNLGNFHNNKGETPRYAHRCPANPSDPKRKRNCFCSKGKPI